MKQFAVGPDGTTQEYYLSPGGGADQTKAIIM